MNELFCCIREFVKEWKVFIEVPILIAGFGVAWGRLNSMVKAQRASCCPQIYVYCPDGADTINGLVIKNESEVIATNITIKVSEKRKLCTLFKKLPKCSEKTIPLLIKGDSEKSIFDNKTNLNNFSSIKVKVKYHSPYYWRKKLVYKNKFNRGGNYE
jgi:hypothetical protein